MKTPTPLSLTLLLLSLLAVVSNARDFDFFFFVQQWPGSYCDTANSCCYPRTGKPAANFGIHGLWPNYKDGSFPSNCNPNSPFVESQIKDLITSMHAEWPTLACPSGDGSKFWSHEWEKHGTCSESTLDEHSYFQAALDLKKRVNLRQVLKRARIEPDGGSYSLNSIYGAIRNATGFTPGIECNEDESGSSQLYQVYICVDANAKDLIECPVYLTNECSSSVKFPTF